MDIVEGTENKPQMPTGHVKVKRFFFPDKQRVVKTSDQNIQSVCF